MWINMLVVERGRLPSPNKIVAKALRGGVKW